MMRSLPPDWTAEAELVVRNIETTTAALALCVYVIFVCTVGAQVFKAFSCICSTLVPQLHERQEESPVSCAVKPVLFTTLLLLDVSNISSAGWSHREVLKQNTLTSASDILFC